MPTSTIDTALLTPKQLAAYLGKPLKTIQHWRQIGYGPQGFRLGRTLHYRKTTVDAWLSEMEQTEASRTT